MFETITSAFVIAVASNNPVKVRAAEQAISLSFPQSIWQLQPYSVPSGVAEQPMSEQETRQGALNRLNNLKIQQPNAEFYVAFEGGYDRLDGLPCTFAYVAVSHQGQTLVGRSAALPLPESIAQQLEQGAELGPLMDQVFQRHNIKQQGGAIGILTGGLLERSGVYRDTLLMLLAPFRYPELYTTA